MWWLCTRPGLQSTANRTTLWGRRKEGFRSLRTTSGSSMNTTPRTGPIRLVWTGLLTWQMRSTGLCIWVQGLLLSGGLPTRLAIVTLFVSAIPCRSPLIGERKVLSLKSKTKEVAVSYSPYSFLNFIYLHVFLLDLIQLLLPFFFDYKYYCCSLFIILFLEMKEIGLCITRP